MKRFTAIALAALMVLTVFASVIPASAATTVDVVEIRGPIFNASDIENDDTAYVGNPGNGTFEINTTNFAGFYYDFKNGRGNEQFVLYQNKTTSDRTIDKDGLVYTTTIINVAYKQSDKWTGTYQKIGYLAEEYVPIKTNTSNKLSKLLMDEKKSRTVRTSQALELGEGYTLTAQQIDVNGDKVWLELSKNGEFVADKVISVKNASDVTAKTWTYEADLGGETDVTQLKVYIDEVFQGQVDSLAVIKGIWQISDNVKKIASDEKVGKMKATSVSGDSITMRNVDDTISLSKNTEVAITNVLSIKTADSTDVRFYMMKKITAPGTYEVRGSVYSVPADVSTPTPQIWTYENFVGFYYDLKNNVGSENISITIGPSDNRSIGKSNITYQSTIQNVGYKQSGKWTTQYQKIGFFAEEFVPIKTDAANKLSKLLMDEKKSRTVRTGQALELGEGYALTAQQIDVNGDKVWLELSKNGEFVADKVISVKNASDITAKTWTYEADLGGETDVTQLKVYIDEVFQGQVDSLAVIKGIWQISDSIKEIASDEKVGILKASSVSGKTIVMTNSDDTVSLTQNGDITIAGEMKVKVSDSTPAVRIYPYVEMTITGEVVEEEPAAPVEEPEAPVEEPEAEPEAPAEPAPAEPAPAVPTPEPEAPEVEVEPPEEEPGFEAIFAIAGLLAVAFLVRRNK